MTDPTLHDPGPAQAFPLEHGRGPVERPASIFHRGPGPCWQAEVDIYPLTLRGYPGTQFEVIARWVGPPLPGTPTPAPGQTVSANDKYVVDELELARAVALAAYDELATANVPDLREIGRRLAARTNTK